MGIVDARTTIPSSVDTATTSGLMSRTFVWRRKAKNSARDPEPVEDRDPNTCAAAVFGLCIRAAETAKRVAVAAVISARATMSATRPLSPSEMDEDERQIKPGCALLAALNAVVGVAVGVCNTKTSVSNARSVTSRVGGRGPTPAANSAFSASA